MSPEAAVTIGRAGLDPVPNREWVLSVMGCYASNPQTLHFFDTLRRGFNVVLRLGGREFTAQNIFTGAVCVVAFLAAIANIGTSLYYLAMMPRLPEPLTGRTYRAGAAYNSAVYVNKGEFAWLNFLHYDLMSGVGVSVVLLAVFVIVPKARREGRL